MRWLVAARIEPTVKFATYGSERVAPGQDTTQSRDEDVPADVLKAKKLEEICLELDGLPPGIDGQDRAVDKTNSLICGRMLQPQRSSELRRRDDTVGALLDALRDLQRYDLARNDPSPHRHRGRRHRVGLVLHHRCRP